MTNSTACVSLPRRPSCFYLFFVAKNGVKKCVFIGPAWHLKRTFAGLPPWKTWSLPWRAVRGNTFLSESCCKKADQKTYQKNIPKQTWLCCRSCAALVCYSLHVSWVVAVGRLHHWFSRLPCGKRPPVGRDLLKKAKMNGSPNLTKLYTGEIHEPNC